MALPIRQLADIALKGLSPEIERLGRAIRDEARALVRISGDAELLESAYDPLIGRG